MSCQDSSGHLSSTSLPQAGSTCLPFACQVPLFASLSPSQKSQLCTALRPLHVKAGTAIVRAGDAGNTFYVVEAGTCTVHSTQGKVSRCFSLHQSWLHSTQIQYTSG